MFQPSGQTNRLVERCVVRNAVQPEQLQRPEQQDRLGDWVQTNAWVKAFLNQVTKQAVVTQQPLKHLGEEAAIQLRPVSWRLRRALPPTGKLRKSLQHGFTNRKLRRPLRWRSC